MSGLGLSRMWKYCSVVGVPSGACIWVFVSEDMLITPPKHRQLFPDAKHGDKRIEMGRWNNLSLWSITSEGLAGAFQVVVAARSATYGFVANDGTEWRRVTNCTRIVFEVTTNA